MRRNGPLTLIVVLGGLCWGVYVYAAPGDFTLDCVSVRRLRFRHGNRRRNRGVGTSDGTADFGGPVPTFASIGLKHPKDLRFILTINVPSPDDPALHLSSEEMEQGFTDAPSRIRQSTSTS